MTTITANGIDINYCFEGPDDQSPVVMFSNSLASRLQMWDLQAPVLIEAGFRVLRYDNRGHGETPAGNGPYSIDLLTRDVVALLDSLAIERVHFCGLSMGGMVGQWLGTHFADRLASLTLSSTAAYMGPRDLWETRIGVVRDGGMAAVVDATIDRWFTKPGQERLPAAVAAVRAGILATTLAGFCECCAAIRDMDQRESIRALATPTMVVVGEEDPSTTVTEARFIHGRIKGSNLEVIPSAAHFVNVEQSAAFNCVLLDFLSRA